MVGDRLAQAAQTRKRILEAAATAFGEHGFAGARVDDIAERAGVNKATVYYHIGGKETLYAAVIGGVLDLATQSLQAALEGVEDSGERFRIIVRTLASMAVRFPHFAPLILREVASGGAALPDDVLRRMAGILGIVAEVFRYGAERGEFREVDPIITHIAVVGGMFFLMAGTPLRRRIRKLVGPPAPSEEPGAEALPETVASLILDGLRAKGGNRET